jgi:hypothetical protein
LEGKERVRLGCVGDFASATYLVLPVRGNDPSLLPRGVVEILLEVDLAVHGGQDAHEHTEVVDHLSGMKLNLR